MIVTLITQDRISTISLPKQISGRYWLTMREQDGYTTEVADVEGIQGQWFLHGSPILALLDAQGQEVGQLALTTDKQVINAKYRKTSQPVQLYIEPSTEDRCVYKKYCVSESCRLDIGRSVDNQIIFDNQYVSAHHACLIWQNQTWSITDTQSSNGTFLNEVRIATKQLKPGDMIYIMGLKIIVGLGYFATNDPDQLVTISSSYVEELDQQVSVDNAIGYREEPSPELFLGSPRVRHSFDRQSITVDAPPAIQQFEATPLALLLGPALTMGLTAVVMAAVAVINLMNGTSTILTSLPTIVMSFSMLCGTLLWPLLTKRNEKKNQAEKEAERQKAYREYLDRVRDELFRLGEQQKSVLMENCPSVLECESWILHRDSRLWERSADQDDFLSLRLGLGDIPLNAEVKFPDKRFSLQTDPLQNEVNRLADTPQLLSAAPITCSLLKKPIIGVVGASDEAQQFLQGLIIQAVALHGYEQLKLVLFTDKSDEATWTCFKYLPHLWDSGTDMRYFAVGSEDEKAVSLHMEHILAERAELRNRSVKIPAPHYLLVAASSAVAKKVALFTKIATLSSDFGFSGLVVADRVTDLPQSCSVVIELDGNNSSVYEKDDLNGSKRLFKPEFSESLKLEELCGIMANLVMHTQADRYELPNLLTFLEMYGVGKTEHLNALTRWRENNPTNTLQAPIGVGQDGTIFSLDLHEKAHGPHGLVAGMTGSGKSEFIITYLLSMAVNYHPDEVSFILIDYKGGGLAGAFEDELNGIRLPHLAGTITNLDGAAVNRALISIQSELLRRQAIFNEAKKATGEGTMDIYKYQKLYRSGAVSEPVPHLFVVSDEFAELKAQQPEFMTQLISAARIGRSLGVHLILATQKPTGVVDDQIWSNSRFRVCLKVQERADSMEMLKRPDAAELKETGRFYLQVGFNELFELGQSAWCGAPYVPVDRAEKKRDDRVAVIDHLGRVMLEIRPKAGGTVSGSSQVVSIVKYLSALATAEHISARRLWLPPLPALIYLDELIEKYQWTAKPLELEPVIGEYDDPFNQSQRLLTIPLSREGNALIYGAAGGGKTTLLNTMLVCLLRTYDADQLNIYIVDLGEETLRVFSDAPQVGDVLLPEDGEKIRSLFKMLQDEIATRKKRFTEGDGSYSSYYSSACETAPQILVIIRNYSAFAEQFEDLDDRLIQITRECNKYGIYFLVTANAANTVRYRVAQNFGGVYALQLNDTSDYIGMFSGTGGVYPSKIKGRGLCKMDRVYEFQTAHFAQDSSQQAIRTFVNDLSVNMDSRARPVPTLPERVVASLFQDTFTSSAVPIGVEKVSLRISTWDLNKSVISLALSQNTEELGATVQGIAEQLSKLDNVAVTVLDGAGLIAESEGLSYGYLRSSFSGRVEALFQEMVRRNNTYKQAVAAQKPIEQYSPEFFVITGLQSIFASLSEQGKDELNTLLEKAELHYNARFILCDSPKEISAFSGTTWYRRHISSSDGLWIGDGIADQYVLKIGKLNSSLYSEVPPHFGYLVKRGKPTLLKLIIGENYEEEMER
mgnify:CR=1 FL=1